MSFTLWAFSKSQRVKDTNPKNTQGIELNLC